MLNPETEVNISKNDCTNLHQLCIYAIIDMIVILCCQPPVIVILYCQTPLCYLHVGVSTIYNAPNAGVLAFSNLSLLLKVGQPVKFPNIGTVHRNVFMNNYIYT